MVDQTVVARTPRCRYVRVARHLGRRGAAMAVSCSVGTRLFGIEPSGRTMNRYIRQIAVVAALILLIAACGSSESTTDDQAEADSSTTTTPTTLRTTTTTTTTTLPTPTTVVFDRPAESLWDRIQAEEGLSIFAEAVEGEKALAISTEHSCPDEKPGIDTALIVPVRPLDPAVAP